MLAVLCQGRERVMNMHAWISDYKPVPLPLFSRVTTSDNSSHVQHTANPQQTILQAPPPQQNPAGQPATRMLLQPGGIVQVHQQPQQVQLAGAGSTQMLRIATPNSLASTVTPQVQFTFMLIKSEEIKACRIIIFNQWICLNINLNERME